MSYALPISITNFNPYNQEISWLFASTEEEIYDKYFQLLIKYQLSNNTLDTIGIIGDKILTNHLFDRHQFIKLNWDKIIKFMEKEITEKYKGN